MPGSPLHHLPGPAAHPTLLTGSAGVKATTAGGRGGYTPAVRRIHAATVDEIPAGRATTVAADGLELAVFNAGGGRYHAVSAACPHEGGPLGDGLLDRGMIICPWHGFDFDPATGVCKVDPELCVTVYPVLVEDGVVLVELPGAARAEARAEG